MDEENQKVVEEENQTLENQDNLEENVELEISFNGETPTLNEDDEEEVEEEQQTEGFRNLRAAHKATAKELKKVKQELEAIKSKPVEPEQKQEEVLTLPNKPKLEDFDYDEEQFSNALDGWYSKKLDVDSKKKQIEEKQKQENERWAGKMATYQEEAKKLNVSDYEDSEELVKTKLSGVQQGILIEVAKNSAQLVYALGKSSKLNDLSKIENPVLFAAEVARLETQIKVNSKTQKSPPAPEKKISGSGGSMNDTKLEQLRKEAEKTGDFSKVIAYKNKNK